VEHPHEDAVERRRRWPIALAAGVLVLVVAAVAVVVVTRGEPDPYAQLRQVDEQDIPGALGFALEPPPADARPMLTPKDVERRYPADGGEVHVAFASIRDRLAGKTFGPGWVLFARGVCLRNAKGELVSDARGDDPNNLACSDATVWILSVDPVTAEPLLALTGYDESGTFGPHVAG
jgi:hypothetical protein